MKKFKNKNRDSFLKLIPAACIEHPDDLLTTRCKFNFGYMDFNQKAGQKFSDWSKEKLSELLDKLHYFSKEPLDYWQTQIIGKKSSKVLVKYDSFPIKSKFIHPKHVPIQAQWARFRINFGTRFVGFVIPDEYSKKSHDKTGVYFDCNTFYVVFLDENHDFCL